jgi:hypothetical protein
MYDPPENTPIPSLPSSNCNGFLANLTVCGRIFSITVSQVYPINLSVYVPCANGGAGEFVFLTGTVHHLYSVTLPANGGYSYTYLGNSQGISGTGETTGAKYQGTGETSGHESEVGGFVDSFSNNFKIIGQVTGNNFLDHENLQITVNANGPLTATVDN